jgi:Na+:H+ antiporter, NhaA family
VKHNKNRLFDQFLNSEQSSGIVLMLVTIVSIALANSAVGPGYLAFWQQKIGFFGAGVSLNLSVEHWVNDGLMAVFFLLIGLEIERELYIGKLAHPREAALPAFAALGGMALPALIHFLLNRGTPFQAGIGIPMATDIAFALGVLALMGNRVPASLKIFLAALAIIDDLGAIVLIALFYAQGLSMAYFASALIVFFGLLILNRFGVNRLSLYLIPGVLMWYCLFKSGVHATLAGVLLAFAIPFCQGEDTSPSSRLLHWLHRPVAFVVMPLFALANTGIVLGSDWFGGLATASSAGIFCGLVFGKPLGIALFSLLAVRLGLACLPEGVNWRQVFGAGLLGGIGFTMSIFITLLAFNDPATIQSAKITVLLSSVTAGIAGYAVLRKAAAPPPITST